MGRKETDRQTGRERERDRQTERGRERDGERQTQADRQAGRQRETDREGKKAEIERQTDICGGGGEKEVSKLVFYAQSTSTVISERWGKGERRQTDRQTENQVLGDTGCVTRNRSSVQVDGRELPV